MTGIVRYRYWLVSPAEWNEPAKLDPLGPKDTTVWRRGLTTTQCRHNRDHTPPEPGCTCGLYAMGVVDLVYSTRLREWAIEQAFRLGAIEKYGLFMSAFYRRRVPPHPTPVIGRVRLFDTLPADHPVFNEPHPAGGDWPRIPAWRARAAQIEALWVLPERADAADQLAERYGVPCYVGRPDYTHADWEARTRFDELDDIPHGYPPHADFDLHPPKEGSTDDQHP